MQTGVDHLQRPGSVYRWRRRLPHALALQPDHCISRSLDTANPDIARRRARACSAYFDLAVMRLVSNGVAPTREEMARVLDDVFRRVLDDGERTRLRSATAEQVFEGRLDLEVASAGLSPDADDPCMTTPSWRPNSSGC